MPKPLRLLDPDGLASTVAAQDGVVSRDQLAAAGYDADAVAHRVASGRWRRVGRRVVVTSTGDPTFRQRLWVAVLHSGPESVLAGPTAAEADGLRAVATPTLHTLVPHGADAARLVDPAAGVVVVPRQSRRLSSALVHPTRRPRRLLLPEAVVDAAEHAGSDGQARLAVIAAVQQRLLRPDDLQAVLAARGRILRRGVISEAVEDAAGGVQSIPEREWSRAIRRYGLPEPVRQVRVRRADGSWYLDAGFDAYAVAVEINGSQHAAPGALGDDDHRRNVLATGGRLVITIGSHVVRRSPGTAVVVTAAGLLARGWTPTPAVRRRLEDLADAEGLDLATGDRAARRRSEAVSGL